LQIGIRGTTLKALEEKIIMAVARVNKERRRDGGNDSTRLTSRKQLIGARELILILLQYHFPKQLSHHHDSSTT
jgi:hypothetical protein